jgi:uncharacterized membrane protein YdbT with pleckstrin-like domain
MSYIDRSLLDDEHVLFRTRLHWKLLIGPVLLVLVTLLPAAWLSLQSSWRNWTLIPPGVGLVFLLAAILKRQSSDFAVTNRRVMMKVGVFSTRSVELLLNKVEAIAVNQTLAGRVFGYGDIVVTGSGGTEERFPDIQAPLELRRAVQAVTDVQTRAQAATANRP